MIEIAGWFCQTDPGITRNREIEGTAATQREIIRECGTPYDGGVSLEVFSFADLASSLNRLQDMTTRKEVP